MDRRFLLAVMTAAALALAAVLAESAGASIPAWTTYRHDASRSGVDPDSTSPVTPSKAWQTPALDGEVYAQPLVYGPAVYVATENDTIYALNSSTGAVMWSTHLATPEPSADACDGDIAPTIGITGTPVIDPAANRIYAVGAVSASGTVAHELFALDLTTGAQVAGFPIMVDPAYPSGGSAANQLQRPGLALDDGRILIGYGGNDGDCNTYWGWLVSAPTDGTTGLSTFQADSNYHDGAIWGGGDAPPIDASDNAYVATGNGNGDASSDPDYGDAVVKLSALASPLDWWAPLNWQMLDASDLDLGSSMPTLLPDNFVFQSGKDGNGYLLGGANLGNVTTAVAQASGFCSGESDGGSVYDPANSTIYAACTAGLKALTLGLGSTPTLAAKSGFSAPGGATGPPIIAGGLVWATNYGSGTLYGLNPTTGATSVSFSIPESGSQVNHFASPSAAGGQLFVGTGDQVTAYTIAQTPPPSSTGTALYASANPARPGSAVTLAAVVAPAPYAGAVTFTDGGVPIAGCSGIAVSVVSDGVAACSTAFTTPGMHALAASYSGDAYDDASTSAVIAESVMGSAGPGGVPIVSALRLSSSRVSIAGRKVGGRCVKAPKPIKGRHSCRLPVKLAVTYTLNAAATITVTLARVVSGRKVTGRCAVLTKHNRKRPRCTRLVAVPRTVTLPGTAGANGFTFGAHNLLPGTYRLTLVPTAGTPDTATLTLVG